MRRDIGFYVAAPIEKVYQSYLSAAAGKPFNRSCAQEPYHTISFGLNFSFKYNINGGSCTIHFAPDGAGTAVNFRFSIVQMAGARCARYAQDMNDAMQRYLPVVPRPMDYNIEDFLRYKNSVNAPLASSAPAAAAQNAKFCGHCGSPMSPDARFCGHCGTAAPAARTCSYCGTEADAGSLYCSHCGKRL